MPEVKELEPGPALDAKVEVEVMGKKKVPLTDSGNLWGIIGKISPYSSSIAASREMEDEIERRGLGREYANHLADVVGARVQSSHSLMWWMILRATPHHRCLAALKAVANNGRPVR